jgi:hypothetical protein
LEIIERAKGFQAGEGISAFESEANVREEVNRRSHKAGYTDRDGQPRDIGAGKGDVLRPVSKKYYESYKRLFGEPKLNQWPRDEAGNLIN